MRCHSWIAPTGISTTLARGRRQHVWSSSARVLKNGDCVEDVSPRLPTCLRLPSIKMYPLTTTAFWGSLRNRRRSVGNAVAICSGRFRAEACVQASFEQWPRGRAVQSQEPSRKCQSRAINVRTVVDRFQSLDDRTSSIWTPSIAAPSFAHLWEDLCSSYHRYKS